MRPPIQKPKKRVMIAKKRHNMIGGWLKMVVAGQFTHWLSSKCRRKRMLSARRTSRVHSKQLKSASPPSRAASLWVSKNGNDSCRAGAFWIRICRPVRLT